MYAVVNTSGRQLKVEPGQIVRLDYISTAKEGDKLSLDKVLLVSDGQVTRVGTPYLEASVSATVLGHGRSKKVIVFKKKRRVDYHKKLGHRQWYTTVRVDAIEA